MSAIISGCGRYRYLLWRDWDLTRPACGFLMLNPSTADASVDDPTIRKCVGYAKRWGYGSLRVANLFAWRAADPRELKTSANPIGEDNDNYLSYFARSAEVIVCAWGQGGKLFNRAEEVLRFLPLEKLKALRVTSQPWHPLYLPNALTPRPFKPKGGG